MDPDRDYHTCGWAKFGTTYCAHEKREVDVAHCYHCGTWAKYYVKRAELTNGSRQVDRGDKEPNGSGNGSIGGPIDPDLKVP